MAIPSKLLNDGESVVVSTRTHPKALLLPLLLLVAILAITIGINLFVGDEFDGNVGWVMWGLAGIATLWFVAHPVLAWWTSTYTITTQRLITRSGIITRRGHDIPLPRINDVAYEYDLIDRLLGCGTLVVSVASTGGTVKLYDVPRAEKTLKELKRLLFELHTRGGHDGT